MVASKRGKRRWFFFFLFSSFFFFFFWSPVPLCPANRLFQAECRAFTSNHSTGMVTHITRFLPQRPLRMTLSYWHGVLFQREGSRRQGSRYVSGDLKSWTLRERLPRKSFGGENQGGFWQWVHRCLADMSGFRGHVESCSRDLDKALLLSALSSWWWRFPSKLHELHLQNKKTIAESVFGVSMCRSRVGHAAVWTMLHFQHKISSSHGIFLCCVSLCMKLTALHHSIHTV